MIRTVSTRLGAVSYELERKRVKNINLRVRRDGSVYVSLPYNTAYSKADEFVGANVKFIFAAQEKVRRVQESSKQTDKVHYLGDEVEVAAKIGEKTGWELRENRLILTVREDSPEERSKALDGWRRAESERLFPAVCREKWELFRLMGYDIPYPKISYRKAKSRWGSCTAKKEKIMLNIMLIEKPMICIEQVVVHELAHFVVQDHSARFYGVMDRVMPLHREVKKILG